MTASTPTPSPAPDAAVIRMGRRLQRNAAAVAGVIGLLVLNGVVGIMAGREPVLVRAIQAGLLVLLFVGIGIFAFVRVRKRRDQRLSLDRTGVWYHDGTAEQVIPWDALAGAGLYSSSLGRAGRVYSLELCPNRPIDRDDPVLWPFVRDEEPLDPSLPRLRYRIRLMRGTHPQVAEAFQRCVPQLWLGEAEVGFGHIGRPDVEGHRARTGGHGN
ncbi:hypothetical protein [Streptomyces halobius]|uniref:PH (Pleckstrin Homology) domain-containing protein n=1 Tax=Streptomyces halobius TaxID=2879846 RepID=A0ABY4MDS4_9ACTN|nr:hypothetical protein [Streptomyces halobius]UQA95877.1 hypothetical protein K9S39_31990 [Streptomyces halobius]